MHHPVPLIGAADRDAARHLVDGTCLRYEPGFDDLLGIFEAGRLIACGARSGRVLKMLVVDRDWRGRGLLALVVGELMARARGRGLTGFFIYTSPGNAARFESLGFRTLVANEHAALLEHGNGFSRWLRERAALLHDGNNAAVLVNADPFSCGHAQLVERAAGRCDTLYLLVPSEGVFAFPLDLRLEMARRCTAHLTSVVVTESGPYSLGAATFPAYFLPPDASPDEVRLALDADLFGARLAPALGVRTRVVGSEPGDPSARAYNRMLHRRLARWNVRVEEVERETVDGHWVDTRRVVHALSTGDLDTVASCVPAETLALLTSSRAATHVARLASGEAPVR